MPADRLRHGFLILAVLALASGGTGELAAATASGVSYPTSAFLLPISQKSQLQAALDLHKVVRLDHGDYVDTTSIITIRSGYRLYGRGTTLPQIVIAPGTTDAVLSGVTPLSVTFPASNQVTKHNLFKSIRTHYIIANATLEENLFLDSTDSMVSSDTSVGGYLRNNRFIRLVGNGIPRFIEVKGDAGRLTFGNVFLWVNLLNPQPVSGGVIYFNNLGDMTVVETDAEMYTNTAQPLIQTTAMGTLRCFAFNGYAASGIPLDSAADEVQLFEYVLNSIQGADVLFRPQNQRSLLTDMYTSQVTDQTASAFRFGAYNTLAFNATRNSIPLTAPLSSGDQTTLAGMIAPVRGGSPWERPTFDPIPDPGGAGWNTGLAGHADDSAMIQGLITTQGFAILPAGTYYIDNPIRLGANNGLTGSGMDKTLIIAKNPNMDMIVGDGSVGLHLTDLTLQGGGNGIHHSPATVPSKSSQFFNIVLSHVTFRNMSSAGIFIDQIYAWDNDFVDFLNFADCAVGFKQHPNPNANPGTSYDICYMDKVMFYQCQFVRCSTGLDLPAGRASNTDAWINCLFQDNTAAAGKLANYNTPLFANCDFINNAGTPSLINTGDLNLVSCNFRADARGSAMVYSSKMNSEGCTFSRGTSTTATILSNSGFHEHTKHFYNCSSADMPMGPTGAFTCGVLLNSSFLVDPGLAGRGVLVATPTTTSGTSLLQFSPGVSNPSPQLLYGAAFTAQFVNTVAGISPPIITFSLPSPVAVKPGGTATYTLTYTGATAITLADGDVIVNATGSAAGSATVSGSGTGTRTVTISGTSGNGTLSISIAANTAVNADGLSATFSGPSPTMSVDSQPPTVAISSSAPATTAANPIPVTVTFNEPVTGFTLGGIIIGNGSASGLNGSGASYAFNITPLSQGVVTADIAAGAAQDLAGNDCLAAPQFVRTFANTGPTVTINQAADQSDPSPTPSVVFTAVFSGAVADFTASDVVITGTAAGTKLVAVAGSGTTYTVTVTGMSGGGTVIASIPADRASLGGVPNPASTSTDNTVTYTFVPPSNSGSGGCGGGITGFLMLLALIAVLRLRLDLRG